MSEARAPAEPVHFSRQTGREDIHVSLGGLLRAPPHILIACMPESGSAFLSDMIAELPGFRRADLVPEFDRREQELDEFCLRGADPFGYVAHHHVRYSQWTHDLCRDYAVTPIVLVRDLLDVVVSLRDHVRNESAPQPLFFADAAHAQLEDARLEEMIVRLALPWYLNFYMSWRGAPDALVIRYEDLTTAPGQTVREILKFSDVHASRRDIDSAIERALAAACSRRPVGTCGHGSALSPTLATEVLKLLDFYPDASNDPYIQSVRTQARAVIEGTAAITEATLTRPPPAAPVRQGSGALGRWWKRNYTPLVMRVLAPIALCGAAVAYWAWPNDLAPDAGEFGRLDDVVALVVGCLAAGRLTKYRPRPDYLRRRTT